MTPWGWERHVQKGMREKGALNVASCRLHIIMGYIIACSRRFLNFTFKSSPVKVS